jgi:putative ABC transport system substrate-binding protein
VTSRRTVLVGLGGVLAVPWLATAQPSGRSYRIGMLDASGRTSEPYYLAFYQRLRELGFVEGGNLVIEHRTSGGRPEKLPGAATDLARQQYDVLVAPGTEAGLVALERATRDTPIVVIAVDYDPEATGHVASLARPGGRVTGVSAVQSLLPAKRLELLLELLPRAKRIAVLSDSASTGQLEVARAGARRLGLELQVLDFKRAPYDYERAFSDAVRTKADAMLILGSANFVPARPLIPELALKHRLPSMFHHSGWTDAGGLVSYGPNFSDVFRQGAEQVARILKGAKPAELPIEQPTKFELVINLETAKALGLTIPPSLLLRADRVIDR